MSGFGKNGVGFGSSASGGSGGGGSASGFSVAATAGATSVVITALIGLTTTKIVYIARGANVFSEIVTAPTVPTGNQVSIDFTTGTCTVNSDSPFFYNEIVSGRIFN